MFPPSLPHFPIGTYTITLTADELRRLGSGSPGKFPGIYEVEFAEINRYTVRIEGFASDLTVGLYTLTQDQITFDDGDRGICSEYRNERFKKGTYRWQFDGKAITFTTTQDDCVKRVASMTAKPWVKK